MAQRLAALAALLVAPSFVAAQTITITESNDQDTSISIAECTAAVTDQLTFSWTTTTSGPFDLWASDTAGCPIPTANANTNAKTKSIAASIPVTTTSLTNLINAPSLINLLGLSCSGSSIQLSFCLFAAGTNTGGTTATASATGAIGLDLQAPPPPVANTPTPGDGALNVSWSQGNGSVDGGSGAATQFRVYCDVHPQTSPIAKRCAVSGNGTTNTRIEHLTNGTEYDIEITAATTGGNESGRSNLVSGTPEIINDFWRLYRQDGGHEQGGCALGAGGLVALLALVPLALRRRRRQP